MSNTLQLCFLSRSRLHFALLSSNHSWRHWREIWRERQSKKYWERVHFKGTARRESQKESLMICGTHLERRDGAQALLGLPSCSAEINNIHLSWKYDKCYQELLINRICNLTCVFSLVYWLHVFQGQLCPICSMY